MRSSKKLRAVSMLSMAAAATLGARAAHGATLSLFYDNIKVLDSVDNVLQTYNFASSGGNYANIPTTINIGVGDTFEFGVDAVVTNNLNPDGGDSTGMGTHHEVQPSFLGLSTLSIVVPSSDANVSRLLPGTVGSPNNSFAGQADFESTASLNNSAGVGDMQPANGNPGGSIPAWENATQGDVSPTSSTGGDVGDHFAIFQGNGQEFSQTAAGVAALSQYGAQTASFASATDFFSHSRIRRSILERSFLRRGLTSRDRAIGVSLNQDRPLSLPDISHRDLFFPAMRLAPCRPW